MDKNIRLLLIFLMTIAVIVDIVSFSLDFATYKDWYECLLAIELFIIVILFFKGSFITALMGFSFLAANYAALAVNFAENSNGIWYFRSYEWDDIESVRLEGLQIMNLGSSLYILLALLFSYEKPLVNESLSLSKKKVRIYKWVSLILLALSIPILELTTSGLVSNIGYTGVGVQNSISVKSSGLKVVGIFCVVSSLVLICVSSKKFRGGLNTLVIVLGVFLMIYYQFLRGERSGSLGYFVVLLIMFYKYGSWSLWKKIVILPISGAVLLIVLLAVGTIRHAAAHVGLSNAIIFSWEVIKNDFLPNREVSSRNEEKSYYIDADLLSAPTQMYWHTLSTIHLRRQGFDLGGQSFIDIIPQALPKFLTDPLKFERPLNGAWKLASTYHMRHGGGMYLYALGYWNFGKFGVALTAFLFFLILFFFEYLLKVAPVLFASAYYSFLSVFLEGPYYGWQPLSKSLQFALVVMVVTYLIRYVIVKIDRVVNSRIIISETNI